MAIDAYMYFLGYQSGSDYLPSESQVKGNKDAGPFWSKLNFQAAADAKGIFEVEDFSFDIEQVLSIGSQSTGSGAGKVTFNPFSITRKIDKSSATFFQMACSGKSFQTVALGARKSVGQDTSGFVYLVFTFKMVAVKTISWSYDDEAPKETVTFEYGGLVVSYAQQDMDGKLSTLPPINGGWNRINNIADSDPLAQIKRL